MVKSVQTESRAKLITHQHHIFCEQEATCLLLSDLAVYRGSVMYVLVSFRVLSSASS